MKTKTPSTLRNALTSSRETFGLVLLTVIALIIRVRGIGELWINPDEGIYFQIATRTSPVSVLQATAAHAHPPLYYLLLWGVEKVTSSLTGLRSLSILCGTLTPVASYLLFREISNRSSALILAFAVAVAPGHVILSQILRPYSLFLLLTPLALLGLIRSLKHKDPSPHLRMYVWPLCLLMCIHYAGFLVFFAGSSTLFLAALIDADQRQKWKPFLLTAYPLGVCFLAVMAVNFQFALGHGMIRTLRSSDWLIPLYITDANDFILNLTELVAYMFTPKSAPIFVGVLIAGVVLILRCHWRVAITLFPILVLVAFLSWLKLFPLGGSRHALFLIFYLFMPVAFLLSWLIQPEHWKERADQFGATLLIFIAVLASALLSQVTPVPTHLPQWEQIVTRSQIYGLTDALRSMPSELPLLCDEQTFQLVTPVLEKSGKKILLEGNPLHLASDTTYRFGNLEELSSGLTDSLKTRSLLMLSRWGRAGVLDELESLLRDSEHGMTLYREGNIGLFVVEPEFLNLLNR
jgi:hypothetical protein